MSVPAEVAGDIHPKYLALLTASSTCPCSIYCVWRGVLEDVTLTTRHLEGLNFISHLDPMSAVCQGPSVICRCRFGFLGLGKRQCHQQRDAPVRQCYREGH